MKPVEEIKALMYWIGPMCDVVPATRCYVCKSEEELVPPEMLYYSCRRCFSSSYTWTFLEATDGAQED